MNCRVEQIKRLVKNECSRSRFIDSWFYDVHLLGVERFAKELLKKLPQADREIVWLGVWLHDLGKVRGIKGNHAKRGAAEAEKVMRQFGYPEKMMPPVKAIILSHGCKAGLKPKTLEGKILASADAMSHYANDFYLTIAVTGEKNLSNFKKWALEKLAKDYNKKIFFAFARKMIARRHEILKEVLTME